MENQGMSESNQPTTCVSKPKMLIIGIGNILLQDQGIGVHIIKELQKMNLPNNIYLVDGSSEELHLMDYMNKGIEKVMIIDAIKGGRVPGTTFRLSPVEIMSTTKHIYSLHQTELIEIIKIIDVFARKPREIVIMGVVPKEIEWGFTISPELQGKIPQIIKVIFDEIEKK